MKITMYDLLGMVKDDKAPKKIKYVNLIWEYDEETKDYINDNSLLFYEMNSIGLTEREVEIIEEEKKIPEKLNLDTDELRGKETPRAIDYLIEDKINEIIDFLK